MKGNPAIANSAPVILELLGYAGAGKTTLENELNRLDPRICLVPPPPKVEYVPFLAGSAPLLLSMCARERGRSDVPLSFRISLLAYLEAWPDYVTRWAVRHDRIAIINPGPTYWLCATERHAPSATTADRSLELARRAYGRWMGLLKLIVWLDAPVEVLVERLYARDAWRTRQGQHPQELADRCRELRMRFAQKMSAMAVDGGPRVLQFRTDQTRPEEIARKVLAELALMDDCGAFTEMGLCEPIPD